MKIRGNSLKTRLLAGFIPVFVFFALAIFIYNHISMQKSINSFVGKRLSLLLNSISITFKSMVNISIRSYLKGIAEKSKAHAEHNHELMLRGATSYNFARTSLLEKFKRHKVGKEGGIFLIDVSAGTGKHKILINKSDKISRQELFILSQKAVSELEGFGTLKEKISENAVNTKPAYYIYIKKWQWVLIAFCDRKDAKSLIDLDVINQDLLSMKIGENGYVGVMDKEANLLIHPWNQNENAYYHRDYGRGGTNRKYIFRQMLEKKQGHLSYYWEYGNGIEKSVMYFRQIEDMDLILFLSASLEEHYRPLRNNIRMSILFLFIALLIVIPLIFIISDSVARPIIKIASVIKEITNNLDYKEVNIVGNKEAIELATSFNFMIAQIRDYSQHLEELVEKRAGELARTNDRLELEISEKLEAEKALKSSEAMLQLVMDSIPVAIFWKDRNLIYIGCNTLFATNAGIKEPKDIIGKSDYDLGWKNTHAESLRGLDERVLKENKGFYHDTLQIELASGNVIWADVNRLPLHDAEGSVVGILGTYDDITERKKTEDELKKYREHLEDMVEERSSEISKMFLEIKDSQRRIQGLLDAVPDIILIFNKEGDILDFHSSKEDAFFNVMLQKDAEKLEDLLSKDIRKKLYKIIIGPDKVSSVNTFSAEMEFGGEVYDYEFRVVSSGDGKGIAIIRNVTEKRKAEKEIEGLNLFREKIIDNADIIIVVIDDSGKAVVWNKAGEIVTGYSKEEMLHSSSLWDLLIKGKEEKKEAVRVFERALNYSEIVDDYHTVIETKSGDEKIVSWNARSLPGAGYMGKSGIIAIGRDITDRLKAEEALRLSEQRLKLALEAANDGIWDYRISIGEIYYSPRCYTMLGYKPYEFKSDINLWKDIIHPDDREGAIKRLNDFISGKGEHYQNEFRNKAKDGSYHWILTRGNTVEWSDDKLPARVVGTRFDITARRKAEEEKEKLIIELGNTNAKLESLVEKEVATRYQMEAAYEETRAANEELEAAQGELEETNSKLERALLKSEEANKVKSEFLAIMSHELRTPLTGMLGFSELLSRDEKLSATQKNFASLIHNAGKRLLNVLSDLLEISVIEAGKINIENSAFRVEDIIDDIYILLKEEFEKKNIDFIKKLSGIDKIYSDPTRLRQILLNIIGNAVKFTKEGFIEVSLKKEKGYYIFKVEDTGIGIKKENLEAIFDKFTQAESYSRRTYGGTGLGLNICKKLVEALKGEIWVDSAENRGSVFYFSLPVLSEKEGEENNLLEPLEKEPLKAAAKDLIKLLFAEDDEINFKFIEDMLSIEKNIKVNGFINGKELLTEFESNRDYDIILLDIQMPVMDGEECLAEIRKLDDKIPVIALTAFAMKTDRAKYLKAGFTDYLSKPLKVANLLDIIHKYSGGR